MATVLCRFRFPSFELCPSTELYVRPVHNAEHSVLDRQVRLGVGGIAQFDTYFNAFGVGKWLRHTTVRNLTVAVEISGACRIEVVHDRLDRSPGVIASTEIVADEPTWSELGLPSLDTLGDGAVFLRVTCLGDGATLRNAQWRTSDTPGIVARLGLVITTFNRPAEVSANLNGLIAELELAPSYADRLEVAVVDNGRNLDPEITAGTSITVLPNPNTGGAGGFTRGLKHFRRQAGITHVLFMDDDVSFDPEIVFRTIQVLSYARDDHLCIAGAMLQQSAQTRQFEAGARFVGTAVYPTRALGHDLDLADWTTLLGAEREHEHIDYGAWWYFAFPLSLTEENPIPTFIRGDDVCWGLLHAGSHTVTFNGIGLWHADFDDKQGPLTWFYDTRNFALISVLAQPDVRWWHLLNRYLNICGRSLLCFKYASAASITFGMREFLRGPEHWLTIDHSELNDEVARYRGERIEPLTEALMAVDDLPSKSKVRKLAASLVSIGLLGGHVLPRRVQRSPIGAVPVQQRALHVSPLRTQILYRDRQRARGFVATRDRNLFFRLLPQMLITAGRIPLRFGTLKRSYGRAYRQLVSDEYWEQYLATPEPQQRTVLGHPPPRATIEEPESPRTAEEPPVDIGGPGAGPGRIRAAPDAAR